MPAFCPDSSILAGMDTATLQAWLGQLQTAYLKLASGAKEASASLSQGGNARAVSFQQTDLATLQQTIRLVQAQLGIVPTGRRAIGAKF
jgi:hypothetical protein